MAKLGTIGVTSSNHKAWIKTLETRMEVNASHAARTWAADVKNVARANAPKPPGIAPRTPWAKNSPSGYLRTGRLAESIESIRTAPKKWRVKVGAPHGIFVEYGTRFMIAQPFMRPAIEQANIAMRRRLKNVFKARRI